MAGVIQLLEQDHRKVEQLFQQYQQNPSEQIATQICDELTVHTTVEEELVYPRLAEVDQALEQQATQEHEQAEQLIAQIEEDPAQAQQLMPQLQQAVSQHVQMEETRAFPAMQQQMAQELEQLGQRVEQRKQQLQQQQA